MNPDTYGGKLNQFEVDRLLKIADIEAAKKWGGRFHIVSTGSGYCCKFGTPVSQDVEFQPTLKRAIIEALIRSEYEPVADDTRLKIYLAGKIAKNDWRHELIPNLRGALGHNYDASYIYRKMQWPTLERVIFGEHDCVGPYFLSCDHGGFHGPNSHGYGGPFEDGFRRVNDWSGKLDIDCCSLNGISDYNKAHNGVYLVAEGDSLEDARREQIVDLCRDAISRCSLFFAWIEDPTAFGTLTEIGMASTMGKPIYYALPSETKVWTVKGEWDWASDLWFAQELGIRVYAKTLDWSPITALEMAIKHHSKVCA